MRTAPPTCTVGSSRTDVSADSADSGSADSAGFADSAGSGSADSDSAGSADFSDYCNSLCFILSLG